MAKTPETISHIKIGSKVVKIDAVTVGGRHLPSPSQYLPGASNADNGKILMIRNGSWVLYSPFDLYSEYNGIDCGEQTIPIHDYSLDYLTFDILTTGTIGWKSNGSGYAKTISYSINDGEWTSITAGSSTINVNAGDVVRFKGENTTYAGTNENYSGFGNIGTSTFNVSGNIMSLVYGDNFTGQTTLSDSWVFCCLFDKSNVVSAENLILPATTLTTCCYRSLFGNCTSLTTAPVLPATTLAENCYRYMFGGDVNLENAPVLPAPTLVKECYKYMFQNCGKINYIKCLATNPSTSICDGWVTGVAATGTFVKDRNTTWTVGNSGIPTGWVTVGDDFAVADPVISYENNTVTITCSTTGASIYYRLNHTGEYLLYTEPIELEADAYVETYASYDIFSSDVIRQTCHYIAPVEPGDSDSDSDYGDSDSDFGDSESEVPVIIVSNPVISYSNNIVTITCDTVGATIYYKLGESGQYQTYSSPVSLTESTTVYTYASLSGEDSEVVSKSCVYDYSLDYLTFNVLTGGNILWKSIGSGQAKTISYSINDGEWTSITATSGGTAIPVSVGDSVRFKGTNNTYAKDKSNYSGFDGGTATYNVEGNMMSLIYGDNFVGNNTLTGTYNFCSIFKQSKAISAENMILPATTLTNYCYRAMFSLAPNLITPPALPATTLAQGCYWYMFENCPMSTAPDLPAQTLVQECYGNMFINCSNLNYIKCLATTKSATNCLQNWVKSVAATGTFVKDANTTWSTGVNGIPTGWVVFDGELVEDPVIDFNGENKIEISCETSGVTIYYRLGNSGNYSVYSGPITITEDVTVYTYAEKDGQQSQTVSQECEYSEHIYKFGDLVFASGPLYYGNDGYEIKDSWNYSSYGTVYGKTVGSTFFNFIEMGDLFKKSGFSSSDGQILNTLDPLDGWRLPSKDEWDYIIGSTRPGSTVNGASGKHYSLVSFDHDNNQNTVNIFGLLVFPDNETITGTTLSYFDSDSTNIITLDQFNNYLSQGCIFLHADGIYQTTTGFSSGALNYWSSSDYSESTVPAYALAKQSGIGTSLYSKENCYLPVYLVKDTTYGEETPFEGATKSLNTWTI